MTTRRALVKQISVGILMLAAPLKFFGKDVTNKLKPPAEPHQFTVTCTSRSDSTNFFANLLKDRLAFENSQAISELNTAFSLERKILSFRETIAPNQVTWHYVFDSKESFEEWDTTIVNGGLFRDDIASEKYVLTAVNGPHRPPTITAT